MVAYIEMHHQLSYIISNEKSFNNNIKYSLWLNVLMQTKNIELCLCLLSFWNWNLSIHFVYWSTIFSCPCSSMQTSTEQKKFNFGVLIWAILPLSCQFLLLNYSIEFWFHYISIRLGGNLNCLFSSNSGCWCESF